MDPQEHNYQSALLPLFRLLQTQQVAFDSTVLDARDMFNRVIENPETDDSELATPDQLGKQDVLLVLVDLLWPLARASYFLDPEDPEYEKTHEKPTISTWKEVLAYLKQLIELDQAMTDYAASYKAVLMTHAQAILTLLQPVAAAKSEAP